jgi:hypothetical protein
MVRRIVFLFMAGIIGVFITTTNSYAASPYSMTFSESYKEKVACIKEDGDNYCDVVGAGNFTITSKISLAGIDISQFNSDTVFSLGLEDFSFDATLGQGGFKPKKTSVKYVVSDEDWDGIIRKYLTVTVSWNKTQMTVSVSCVTSPWDIQSPVVAGYYTGENGKITDQIGGQIDIGDLSVEFILNSVATVKTTTVKKYGEEFDISTVTVKATGPGNRI